MSHDPEVAHPGAGNVIIAVDVDRILDSRV
jgi:hypothetical protein